MRTEIVAPVLTPALKEACRRPVAIPKGRLSEQVVVSLWGRDRKELATCGNRHETVVEALS